MFFTPAVYLCLFIANVVRSLARVWRRGGGGADLGGTKGETHEGAHDSAQGTDERSMMEEPMESAREMDRRRPWEGNRNARITLKGPHWNAQGNSRRNIHRSARRNVRRIERTGKLGEGSGAANGATLGKLGKFPCVKLEGTHSRNVPQENILGNIIGIALGTRERTQGEGSRNSQFNRSRTGEPMENAWKNAQC